MVEMDEMEILEMMKNLEWKLTGLIIVMLNLCVFLFVYVHVSAMFTVFQRSFTTPFHVRSSMETGRLEVLRGDDDLGLYNTTLTFS